MQRILFLCSALCTIASASAALIAPGPWDLYIKGPLECIKTANATSCDILENCAWCASSGIGTGCYPLGAAKILPRTYFTCDKLPEHPAEGQDPGLLHKAFNSVLNVLGSPRLFPGADLCDKKPEGSCAAPDCVWCTSAAVGGGCYTPAQAKMLPSAIFKCKSQA
ncbi:hypothetical protein QJQ45_003733 [Haematococcus lacustris]|nr:hypothetical protein QJQ45_003733 [Haematococcus lacustris]